MQQSVPLFCMCTDECQIGDVRDLQAAEDSQNPKQTPYIIQGPLCPDLFLLYKVQSGACLIATGGS